MKTTNEKPLIQHGAEYGLIMGLYMSSIALCFLWSLYDITLTMAVFFLIMGIPVITWIILARAYKRILELKYTYAIWTMGIYVYFFGCLICSAVTAGFIYYVEPDFFAKFATTTADFIASGPEASQHAAEIELLRKAVETGQLPTTTDFCLSMSWVMLFIGSVLSIIYTPIIHKFVKRNLPDDDNDI